MDEKVSPEVQNTVEGEAKDVAIGEDVSKNTLTKEESSEDVVNEVKEKEEKKETTPTPTGQRKPQQQNEDFQRKRMYFRKKVCKLCAQKATSVDYKNVDILRRYITDRGKILPRRITGNCAKHQRMLAKAIKRARMAGLLPFVSK